MTDVPNNQSGRNFSHIHKESKLPTLFQDIIRILTPELIGRSYDCLRLAVCYFMIGGLIHTSVINDGGIHTDTRQSFVVSIEPGFGKSSVKIFVDFILRGIVRVRLPAGLWPAQLLGKNVIRRIKGSDVATPKPGYFIDYFILADECSRWFRRRDLIAQDLWSNIRLALDTYRRNLIEKELTGDLRAEGLHYFAECAIMLFIQLTTVFFDYIEDGTLRRLIPIILDVPPSEKKRIIEQRGKQVPPSQEELDRLRKILALLPTVSYDWCFSQESVSDIAKFTLAIVRKASKHDSLTVRKYAEHMHTTLQNRLYGMSAIVAVVEAVYGKGKEDFMIAEGFNEPEFKVKINITPDHIRLAYQHLIMFMESTYDFLERLVTPSPSTGRVQSKLIRTLEILLDRGFTEETKSTMTIKEYESEIASALNCSMSNARRIYNQLRQNGWIKSKLVGGHGSRVWLTPEGLRLLQSGKQN